MALAALSALRCLHCGSGRLGALLPPVPQVTQHEACELRVTVLNETSSGEHKVKLQMIMLVESGGAAFDFHAMDKVQDFSV